MSSDREDVLSGWDAALDLDAESEFPVPTWSANPGSSAALSAAPAAVLAAPASRKSGGPPEAPWQRWHIDRTCRLRRSRFSAR